MRKIIGRNAFAVVGDTDRCLSGVRDQTETKLCAVTVPEHILTKVVYNTLVGVFIQFCQPSFFRDLNRIGKTAAFQRTDPYSIQDTTSVKIFKTAIDREALVRELTLQGVGLSGLAEKDDTLEDYFKKITGGEGIA